MRLVVLFFATILTIGTHAAHAAPLKFDRACDPAEAQLTVAAVGDVLPYQPLQDQATSSPAGFRSLWQNITDLLQKADLTYANLEGPVADGFPLGGYPSFNYDVRLPGDLVASGIDVVSVANNHTFDRGRAGLERTRKNLSRANLPFSGVSPDWHAVVEAKGFKIAWVACTYGVNRPDVSHEVLYCHEDKVRVLGLVRELSSRADLDAVFVTPHWGEQYEHYPDRHQKSLAIEFFEAGALAVLGAHPHVLQPMERFLIEGRERFVIYSLGDFVSGNPDPRRRTSLIAYLGLSKSKEGGTWINGVRYVPTHLTETAAGYSLEAMDRRPAPAKKRAIIRGLYDPWNELPSHDRLVTNPQCN